jgi:hypothetical protein
MELPCSLSTGFLAMSMRREVRCSGGISLRVSQELRRAVRLCANTLWRYSIFCAKAARASGPLDRPSAASSAAASCLITESDRAVSLTASAETALPPPNHLITLKTSSSLSVIRGPTIG